MIRTVFFVLVVAAFAGACSSSPTPRFYMLHPLQQQVVAAQAAGDLSRLSICVGPVLLPAYLNRLSLCVRESGNVVRYADFHRWAEPLDEAIARVLAENLSHLLGTARIDVFPWRTPAPVDYQVRIMLVRFDGVLGEQAELKARWSLTAAGREVPVVDTLSTVIEPLQSNTYEALVKAQNRALDRLSLEIVAAIQAQQP